MALLQQRLLELLDSRKIGSQGELARKLGVSEGRISKILHATRATGLSLPSAFALSSLTGEDPLVVLRYSNQGKVAGLIEKWCAARRAPSRTSKGR